MKIKTVFVIFVIMGASSVVRKSCMWVIQLPYRFGEIYKSMSIQRDKRAVIIRSTIGRILADFSKCTLEKKKNSRNSRCIKNF